MDSEEIEEFYYWPNRYSFDEDGTLRMKMSFWSADSHISAEMMVAPYNR